MKIKKALNTFFFVFLLLPSDISLSRISHAKIVGFSLLYCSILATTAGVATFGLLPPIKPGGLRVPESKQLTEMKNKMRKDGETGAESS